MATESNSPPRIPLVASTSNRAEVPFDARVVNGYVEKTVNGDFVVMKRPAIAILSIATPGAALGCYYWQGHIYSVAMSGGSLSLLKDGVSVGAVHAGGMYSFASVMGATPRLVIHNQAVNLYTYDGTTLTQIFTLTFVPQPGFAYLDGTLYAAVAPTAIYGSGINDPATWNALNIIQAQQEPDGIVAIAKQLQYVVVFKDWTTEAFWDAGNAVGSPLQSAPGTLLFYGCVSAASLQNFEDMLVWVSGTRSGSVGVMMMENMRPVTISTPAIERLLQDGDFSVVYSWCARISGHRFYCITLKNSNLSLVYDFTTQLWYQWTYGPAQTYLPFVSSTSTAARVPVLQHESGSLYTLTQTAFSDGADIFPVDIYTPNWDGGTRKRKYVKRMEVIGDQAGMATAQIRWSEDDYQTWSNFRPVDLSQKRPFLDDLGTFYKRAFHIRYAQLTAFRIKALELTSLMLGAE